MIQRTSCPVLWAWNLAFNGLFWIMAKAKEMPKERSLPMTSRRRPCHCAQQTSLCPVVWGPSTAPRGSVSNSKNSTLGSPGATLGNKRYDICSRTLGEKFDSLIILHREEHYSQNSLLNQRLPKLTDHHNHLRDIWLLWVARPQSWRFWLGRSLVTQFPK